MAAYVLGVTCRQCGDDRLDLLTGTVQAGTTSIAVLACRSCSTEWSVTVHLRELVPPERIRSTDRRRRDRAKARTQ